MKQTVTIALTISYDDEIDDLDDIIASINQNMNDFFETADTVSHEIMF